MAEKRPASQNSKLSTSSERDKTRKEIKSENRTSDITSQEKAVKADPKDPNKNSDKDFAHKRISESLREARIKNPCAPGMESLTISGANAAVKLLFKQPTTHQRVRFQRNPN